MACVDCGLPLNCISMDSRRFSASPRSGFEHSGEGASSLADCRLVCMMAAADRRLGSQRLEQFLQLLLSPFPREAR